MSANTNLEKTIRLLPEEFRGFMDDRVLWARANKQQDWWPCCCSKLDNLPKQLVNAFVKAAGKKIVMYCYESNSFMLVPPQISVIKSWKEGVDEGFHTRKVKGKKFSEQFPKAVEAAKKEFERSKEDVKGSSSSSQTDTSRNKRKHGKVKTAEPLKNKKRSRNQSEQDERGEEVDIKCLVCGKGDAEELMLLCDGCETGATHTFCCKPPRSELPAESEDWFCVKCQKVSVHGMESGTDNDDAVEMESSGEDEDENEDDDEDYESSQTHGRAKGVTKGRKKESGIRIVHADSDTRVSRILSLVKSVDAYYLKEDAANARRAIVKLDKMNLTVDELRETKAGMELNRIGKDGGVPSISIAARELVTKWKELAKSKAPIAKQKPPSLPVLTRTNTTNSGSGVVDVEGQSADRSHTPATGEGKSAFPARPRASLPAVDADLKTNTSNDQAQRAPTAPLAPPSSAATWEPKSRVSSFSLKALVSGNSTKSVDKAPSGQQDLGNGSSSSSNGGMLGHIRSVGSTNGVGGASTEGHSDKGREAASKVGAAKAQSGTTLVDSWDPTAVPLDCKSTLREASIRLLHNALRHTRASVLVEKAVFESFGSDFDKYIMTINGLSFNLLEQGLSGLVRRIVCFSADPIGASGPHSLDLKLVVSNVDNLFQLGIA